MRIVAAILVMIGFVSLVRADDLSGYEAPDKVIAEIVQDLRGGSVGSIVALLEKVPASPTFISQTQTNLQEALLKFGVSFVELSDKRTFGSIYQEFLISARSASNTYIFFNIRLGQMSDGWGIAGFSYDSDLAKYRPDFGKNEDVE